MLAYIQLHTILVPHIAWTGAYLRTGYDTSIGLIFEADRILLFSWMDWQPAWQPVTAGGCLGELITSWNATPLTLGSLCLLGHGTRFSCSFLRVCLNASVCKWE